MECSSEEPPNMTPTFNLSILLPALKVHAIDETVFYDVAQGVVGVIGGVRTDEHIRHSLQTQQGFTFNGCVSAVGVEDSFLSFEDIQRRAAQSAALQGWNEGLGLQKGTASSIDNERTVFHLRDALTIQEMVCVRVEWGMERDNVAQLQQFIERNVIGSGLRAIVMGKYSAAETSQPVDDCCANASCSNYPNGQIA